MSPEHAKIIKQLLDKFIEEGAGMEEVGMDAKPGQAGLQVEFLANRYTGAVRKGDIDGSYILTTVGFKPKPGAPPPMMGQMPEGDPVIVDIYFTPESVVAISQSKIDPSAADKAPGGGIIVQN